MKSSTYAKVGFFVIAACVIAVAACLVFGSRSFRDRAFLCETYVEGSVQGVSVGSPVKYRGITIGSVREISFAWAAYEPPAEDDGLAHRASRWARVVFGIEDSGLLANGRVAELLAKQVAAGLRATLKPQGITGVAYLDMDFVEKPNDLPAPPWTPIHAYVPSVPGLFQTMTGAMQNVANEVAKLGDVATDVQALVTTAKFALEEGRLPMLEISDNAGLASRLLVETLERVRDDPSLLLRPAAKPKE